MLLIPEPYALEPYAPEPYAPKPYALNHMPLNVQGIWFKGIWFMSIWFTTQNKNQFFQGLQDNHDANELNVRRIVSMMVILV